MYKQLEDLICEKLKYKSAEIISINKYDNLFFGEMMNIVYRTQITYYINGKESHPIKITSGCIISKKELNEFISSQRNEKISNILQHNQ